MYMYTCILPLLATNGWQYIGNKHEHYKQTNKQTNNISKL